MGVGMRQARGMGGRPVKRSGVGVAVSERLAMRHALRVMQAVRAVAQSREARTLQRRNKLCEIASCIIGPTFHDLGGNVWEWCGSYYNGKEGSRVLRGASWGDHLPADILSSCRYGRNPEERFGSRGFRIVVGPGGTIP